MFGLHILDVISLSVYLIGIMIVGIWVARKVKNASDYFMGGRSFGKAFMIMHSFGTGTHTDQAVTVAGAAYKLGMSGIWYQWLYLFATPFY
ncbi:MAG: sodium:solute symporter family protein, partial [Candidatus Latescibacteria bacterium]|nr:sodium:solute symporter family protein [Candidatus Latescibacterota bacterium]